MKIAYICLDKGVPVFGEKGSSIHVQEVLNGLKKRNTSIKLFTNRIGGEKPKELEGIQVYEIPILGNSSKTKSYVDSENQKIKEILNMEGPFDFFYERYSLWSFGAMEYAKSRDIPNVLEVNSPLIAEEQKYRDLKDSSVTEWVAKKVFSTSDKILAVSEGVASYLNSYPSSKNKIHVIPNGVNPDRFIENKKILDSTGDETFLIGFVGTLKPWHGLSTLVEAFEIVYHQNSNTQLMIVGDGPEKNNLIQDLKERNLLSAVKFTGSVPHSEIPSLLSSMDVAVAPYPKIENFYFSPLKVFEYMAAGLPVVSSNIGQLSELIQNEYCGFLYRPGDSEALSKILLRLMKDPKLRKTVGAAAKDYIIQNHTWDIVVSKILSLSNLKNIPQYKGELVQ
jgi:glycosyltransferase involved in cell wall biosynthesis